MLDTKRQALVKGKLGGTGLKHPWAAAFLCSLACAAAFILPFVLRRGGVLYVSNDQITQQLVFVPQIVKNLHAGNFFYDFDLDLGSGLIEGYTWYNLGSVFSLFLLLLPASVTPYLLGPMLIFKFGVAGLFSYIWLRRYTQTDLAALIGSMLYAFSGIAISNMVFPFADVYALFPLLPLGMDCLMDFEPAASGVALSVAPGAARPWQAAAQGQTGRGAYGLFAAAVALNLLANPPLFFGSAVFMLLYFAVKSLWRGWRCTLKKFAHLAGETLCGVALSGFILLPFVASLAANPRVEGVLPFGKDWLVYIAYRYFELIRGLILPAEVMHANSMMVLADAVSPELYLPLFALVPAFAWAFYKKGGWTRALLWASLVCLLVPVLNSAFNAFNATYYTRWVYAPVLVAALATAQVLEQPEVPLKRGYIAWAALALAYCGCMALWVFHYGYPSFISYLPVFVFNLALCAAGLLATAGTRRLWAAAPRGLAAGVALFAIASGGFNLLINQALATRDFGDLSQIAPAAITAAETTPLPEGAYRINSPSSNLFFGHGSPFSFNSTVSPGVFKLQAAFGRQRTSASRIEYDEPGLWSLLGVKYLLMTPHDPTDALPNLELYSQGQPYDVWENKDALPLVMGVDAALPKPAAEALANHQKSIALLHGLVLEAADAEALGLQTLDTAALGMLEYDTGVAARKAMAAQSVELGKATLRAQLTLSEDAAALITLPYEAGWRCWVNGQETPLYEADWGLMATPCPAGQNEILLRYRPVGFVPGLLLSAAGLAGFGALLWWGHRRRKNIKAA